MLFELYFSSFFSEDAGLCGMNGCPFHGMCLRDSELGHYQCACPECYTQDLPNYVCGNDAVTYQSLCHLHQASCLLQKPIIYDYDGYCKKCEVSFFYSVINKVSGIRWSDIWSTSDEQRIRLIIVEKWYWSVTFYIGCKCTIKIDSTIL